MADSYTETINAIMGSLHLDDKLDMTIYDILPKLFEARARHWIKGEHGYFAGSYSDGKSGAGGLTKSGGGGIIKESNSPLRIGLQYFAEIPKDKFTKYALDPLKQLDKARAFREALGYTLSNYQELIDNIAANFDESALKLKGSNEQGKLYEYVMCLTGANGKKANVCTGWIIENGKTEPRLTSAYITEKKVTKRDGD